MITTYKITTKGKTFPDLGQHSAKRRKLNPNDKQMLPSESITQSTIYLPCHN